MEENKKKKEEENEENGDSRRDFLKKLGLLGVGAAGGATALYVGYNYETSKDPNAKTVKFLSHDNELYEVDMSNATKVTKAELSELQLRGREGIPGKSWVMVIDLSKCRNARKCVNSCQKEHRLKPEQYHINTLVMQETETTPPYFMPKPCQHCDNPPCVSVCPVDATFKRQDGPVLIDNERCIGCRFCMAACPYSARSFHWTEPVNRPEDENKTYDIELNVPQKKGTITKCLFSADRLREGELPYCVSACPNGVFYFGDANEDAVTNGTTRETVVLSKLLEDNGAFKLMAELGTKPRVFYLPPKNRLFPFEKPEGMDDHHA